MIVYKPTFFVVFIDEDNRTVTGLTLAEARRLAEAHVGNRSCARPIPNEETYLYGPGDGTTSVMIRREFELE